MDSDLAQEAISAALCGNWKRAVDVNKLILNKTPDDVDCYNRLARAYAEVGNLQKARSMCQKVLKLDPFNNIALKSLVKWKGLKKGDTNSAAPSTPQTFLEEPGKTKIVSLLYLGSTNILAKLDAADEVKLDTHSHRVAITTMDNKYIGRLPDDLSARIRNLVKCGNLYQSFIKSVSTNEVKVFIREVLRVKKMADIASFPSEKIDYVSFTPPELVHKRDDAREETGDEE